MDVLELGTFLLPVRLSLTDLISDGRAEVSAALERELSEFGQAESVRSTGLFVDFNQSMGARQMETLLFQGSLELPAIGTLYIYISSLSVGFVVLKLDLPGDVVADMEASDDWTGLKAYENPLTEAIGELIAGWSERIARVIPAVYKRRRPPAAMEAGKLLWWHRIGVDEADDMLFPNAKWYGVRCALAGGATAYIGEGFSNIAGPGASRHAAEVIDGLMVASQEWIVVDEAKRLLTDHLVRLMRMRRENANDADTQYAEMLQVTEEVTLRNLVVAEELRYLANARIRVRDAAMEAWRITEEVRELDERVIALRDLFVLQRERIGAGRDDRRNRYIFVLTAVTLVQSVLIWYDFITSNENSVGPFPRPLITGAVVVLTFVTLIGALGWGSFVDWRIARANRRADAKNAKRVPAPRPPMPATEDSPSPIVRASNG